MEAVRHLATTVQLTEGWNELASESQQQLLRDENGFSEALREMPAEDRSTVVARYLNACFRSGLSAAEIQPKLAQIASSLDNSDNSQTEITSAKESTTTTIPWTEKTCFDTFHESLPLSSFLTFPSLTHARAGETVQANIFLESNFDVDIRIQSVTILTTAGKVFVPLKDFPKENQNPITEISFVLKARSHVHIPTSLTLPKDIQNIVQSEAAAASKPKTARPRSSGLTSAAGARLYSEENKEWSTKCLGGRVVYGNGIAIDFSMVVDSNDAFTNSDDLTKVQLLIEKIRPPSPSVDVKRTPVDEMCYISSAWMRPSQVPFNLGPRCLSVLPPFSDMTISNVTEEYTGGKVLEGTVNRIVLKIAAGEYEMCTDIESSVTISSKLVSVTGESLHIGSPSTDQEGTPILESTNPKVRTPLLVMESEASAPTMTKYGYEVPGGWDPLISDDHLETEKQYSPMLTSLSCGSSTYFALEIFRPSPATTTNLQNTGNDAEGSAYDRSSCESKIDVSIRYKQQRRTTDNDAIEAKIDTVVLSKSISVVWSPPFSANFSPAKKLKYPSGNRHPTNHVSVSGNIPETELVLIDGERVTTKCALTPASNCVGLCVNIEEINFLDIGDDTSPCRFNLLSGKENAGLLFKAQDSNACKKLTKTSIFSFAWMTEVIVEKHYLKGSVSASLGMLSIAWSPHPIKLPADFENTAIVAHGPLVLKELSKCRLLGPSCYIENAPFETEVEVNPTELKFASPFDLIYHIKNRTAMHQKLKIKIQDSITSQQSPFMMAGFVDGSVSLGPFESHALVYTVIATKTGFQPLPSLCVSSERYQTWLVQESKEPARRLYISP